MLILEHFLKGEFVPVVWSSFFSLSFSGRSLKRTHADLFQKFNLKPWQEHFHQVLCSWSSTVFTSLHHQQHLCLHWDSWQRAQSLCYPRQEQFPSTHQAAVRFPYHSQNDSWNRQERLHQGDPITGTEGSLLRQQHLHYGQWKVSLTTDSLAQLAEIKKKYRKAMSAAVLRQVALGSFFVQFFVVVFVCLFVFFSFFLVIGYKQVVEN